MGESNHEIPAFVWVFMSEFSANGQRGAPTAIFHSKGQADDWINQEQIDGILYEFPIGVALVDHAEPVNGNQAFITKHHDKSSKSYRAGSAYLGFTPHHHYSFSKKA